MLISFTVSNYKSILEPVTLNMVADEDDTTYSNTLIKGTDGLVNPISVIYGPNGSGKSTVLDALKYLKNLICKDFNRTVDRKYEIPPVPRNRNAESDIPTKFRVVFEQKEIYILNLSILNDMIALTLELFTNGNIETVFEKSITNFKDEWIEPFVRNHYFDSSYGFFKNLIVYNAIEDDPELQYNYRLKFDSLQYVNNPNNHVQGVFFIEDEFQNKPIKLFTSLLNKFGTGITDVVFDDSFSTVVYGISKEDAKSRKVFIPEKVCYGDLKIPISEESSGTKRLIKTAFIISKAISLKNQVLLIDELDAGLHDMLSTEIVKQFIKNNSESNCQLIFTTHNTTLMASHMLRKDQIWFTQMTTKRSTELYSLADLDNAPRPTADFAEAYLNGRYGAVPVIPDNQVCEE